jgi:hypothetical protein
MTYSGAACSVLRVSLARLVAVFRLLRDSPRGLHAIHMDPQRNCPSLYAGVRGRRACGRTQRSRESICTWDGSPGASLSGFILTLFP